MKRTLLAIIVILAISTTSIGGTFAAFSDIDISANNSMETGTLDIQVAKSSEGWVTTGDFRDDTPPGLEPCFYLIDFEDCPIIPYAGFFKLRNVGTGDGVAFLGFDITSDSESVAGSTTISIYYGLENGSGVEHIITDTLLALANGYVELDDLAGTDNLAASNVAKLKIEIDPCWQISATLEFDILFGLIQGLNCYSDPETCHAYLQCTLQPEGCTPGFWAGARGGLKGKGGGAEQKGRQMWDEGPPDPDWTANGATGSNPFIHTTLFNDFFTPHPDLDGLTMMDIVGEGGGPKWPKKTARMVIAAYLNASSMNFPYTTTEILDDWAAAVAADSDAAFQAVFHKMGDANECGECPF